MGTHPRDFPPPEPGARAGLIRHSASFRDSESSIFIHGDRVVRTFTGSAVADAKEAIRLGLFERLARDGLIQPFETMPESDMPSGTFALSHTRLPFVSYPYEWSFSMLRAAGLLHLRVAEEVLRAGYTLTDGSAYNVQFIGTRPVFIDLGSFRRHEDGTPWNGYAQFCRHFLYPLLLAAHTGVPHQPLLRSSLDGISPSMARSLLPLGAKLRPSVMTHVVLQDALGGKNIALDDTVRQAARVPRAAILRNLAGLRRTIEGLSAPREQSAWVEYERNATYTSEGRAAKLEAVRTAVDASAPRSVWDLGCNVGGYTTAVADGTRQVIGMDSDSVSIDVFYRAASRSGTRVLPLVMDLTNPSPPQGWAHRERQGLTERGPVDLAMCLALIHHVRFTGGIPLLEFIEWLGTVARSAIVEFVPRSDRMVREMLAWRGADSCPDYSQEGLERALETTYRISARRELPGTERVLYIARPL